MKGRSVYFNSVLLIALSFILKAIGFINRMVIAYYFGTSGEIDNYYVISGFVEDISAIVLSAVSVGVINIYIKKRKESNTSGSEFISNIIVIIFALMVMLFVICELFSENIVVLLNPGVDGYQFTKLKKMLRAMSFAFPLQGFITVYSAVLQGEKKFAPIKITGAITSTVSIVSLLLLGGKIGIYALMMSFLMAYLLNAIFLRVSVGKRYHFVRRGSLINGEIRHLFALVLPLLVGAAGYQMNLIIDRSVATQLTEGSVSALSYSRVIYLFMENVINNSIVTAFFPDMAEKIKGEDKNLIKKEIRNVIILEETIMIPIVIAICFNSTEIIKLIYMRGNFGSDSLYLTSSALMGYIIGMPFLGIRDILTRVYYANDDTKKPVVINLFCIAINVALDFVLGFQFGIIGITIATSVSYIVSGLFMYFDIRKNYDNLFADDFNRELLIQAVAAIIEIIICFAFAVGKFEPLIQLVISTVSLIFIHFIIMSFARSVVLGNVIVKIKGKLHIK